MWLSRRRERLNLRISRCDITVGKRGEVTAITR
jgi:hypothetical protein